MVNVIIRGANKESDEYQAALMLKNIINKSVADSVNGDIVLFASATLYGQDTKDVDLMMVGKLDNYQPSLIFNVKDNKTNEITTVKDSICIESFCTTIEIKRHDISGVFLNGTDIYVKYGKENHCVTNQSNKQRIAAKKFFESVITYSPFITNIIWFTQITESDIEGLLTINGKKMPSNVIGANFDFKDLVQLLVMQKIAYFNRGHYYFDSKFEGAGVEKFDDALKIFAETKKQQGELTRKRIEMLTNKAFQNNVLVDTEGKISIYRGRAGTGKTVGLIQTAIKLVEEYQARVLLLTYNRALVSDIKRLFALAELPDMFDYKCVYINTLQSYFYELSNNVLYNNKMDGIKFLDNYENVLKELNGFLADDESVLLVKEIIEQNQSLYWNYVLIDEAQDWTDLERDIILKLFDKGNIIVADGGLQFVRNKQVCDWSVIKERNNIKLKYCLRQKDNIIRFLNLFTAKFEINLPKILSNNNMPGGKVIISNTDNWLKTHREEYDNIIKSGNTAYDMLYLVPFSMVRKTDGPREFALKSQFEENNIKLWDGTNNNIRNTYSLTTEEIRVLQYDSARGLEGWTVVCMDFDEFVAEKANNYKEEEVDSLLLETPEEKRNKYIYNWIMIPFTRAIDTLVILLKDEDCELGCFLREISIENSDFVIWE